MHHRIKADENGIRQEKKGCLNPEQGSSAKIIFNPLGKTMKSSNSDISLHTFVFIALFCGVGAH